MQFPITIGLHRSSFLVIAIGAAHVFALSVVFMTPWADGLRTVLAVLLAVSAVFAWRTDNPAVLALRLIDPARLACRLAGSADFIEAGLFSQALVHPRLLVLPLEAGGRRIWLAVWPDSAPAEQQRSLRVWLRCRTEVSGAGPA